MVLRARNLIELLAAVGMYLLLKAVYNIYIARRYIGYQCCTLEAVQYFEQSNAAHACSQITTKFTSAHPGISFKKP